MSKIRDAQIGFRVTSELKAQLEELAAADSRPLSNYLELVLRAHAEVALKRSAKLKGTQEKPARR